MTDRTKVGADVALLLKIWGARGSFPTAPNDPSAYGERTCCAEIRAGGRRLIFDAGSGIVALGNEMMADRHRSVDLFLSHAHYDHMMGLPYFAPLYDPSFSVRIHAGHMQDGTNCRELITAYMSPPFHPVSPDVFKAEVEYVTFRPGNVLRPLPDVAITTLALHHPNGAVGYRIERAGRSIVYATDHEHVPGARHPPLTAFVEGADILVYDTTYTDAEMPRFAGYGHSSVEEGIRLCRQAGVARLVLFHHSHKRSDAALRDIEAQARLEFAGTVAARTGLELVLPPADQPTQPDP